MDRQKCIADAMRLMPLGHTFQEIADLHGVSRERVRQVLKESGWKPDFPIGCVVRAEKKRSARRAAEIKKYGMSPQEKWAIRDACLKRGLQNPLEKYTQQKTNARKRGIKWGFTFGTWWEIWKDYFDRYGRSGSMLEMCRKGDAGGYSPDNVYLTTHAQNMRDFWSKKKGVKLADL